MNHSFRVSNSSQSNKNFIDIWNDFNVLSKKNINLVITDKILKKDEQAY